MSRWGVAVWLALVVLVPPPGARAAAERVDPCRLHGRIQIVESFPDVTVQVVDAFPDLRVQVVQAFPDRPGKWQFVTSFPDFKVKFVTAFPDLKIQFVSSFPGCD